VVHEVDRQRREHGECQSQQQDAKRNAQSGWRGSIDKWLLHARLLIVRDELVHPL
jgi:hypothetical protein